MELVGRGASAPPNAKLGALPPKVYARRNCKCSVYGANYRTPNVPKLRPPSRSPPRTLFFALYPPPFHFTLVQPGFSRFSFSYLKRFDAHTIVYYSTDYRTHSAQSAPQPLSPVQLCLPPQYFGASYAPVNE